MPKEREDEDVMRIGPSHGTLCYTLPLPKQTEHVLGYLDHIFPKRDGEDEISRNRRIRQNNDLNPWELYALCHGTFISMSPRLNILLCGSDGVGGNTRARNSHAKPVFLKLTPYRPREDNGGTTWHSMAELERFDKNGVRHFGECVEDFAQKADALIPVDDWVKVFGDKNGETVFMRGKKFCDVWRSSSVSQRKLLTEIAFFRVKEIVLTHDQYRNIEGRNGYWLESRGERQLVEALTNAEYARQQLEIARKANDY